MNATGSLKTHTHRRRLLTQECHHTGYAKSQSHGPKRSSTDTRITTTQEPTGLHLSALYHLPRHQHQHRRSQYSSIGPTRLTTATQPQTPLHNPTHLLRLVGSAPLASLNATIPPRSLGFRFLVLDFLRALVILLGVRTRRRRFSTIALLLLLLLLLPTPSGFTLRSTSFRGANL